MFAYVKLHKILSLIAYIVIYGVPGFGFNFNWQISILFSGNALRDKMWTLTAM